MYGYNDPIFTPVNFDLKVRQQFPKRDNNENVTKRVPYSRGSRG